jgi:hypothetical protein
LTAIGDIPPGICVLIDDVTTSGGHLIAAAWKLEDGGRIARLAVCCGRTAHDQWDDPLEPYEEDLDIAR